MAVRHGDLKLVKARNGGPEPELYDLAKDISESSNLAAAQPGKVGELKDLWDKWNAEQAPPVAEKEPGKKPRKKARAKAAAQAK